MTNIELIFYFLIKKNIVYYDNRLYNRYRDVSKIKNGN